MNVYDRILPNKAISTLWVLSIGIAAVILFDLLLKTARASLIDYAGRKADLRISYMLFEKVLNSSLSARPGSTGEYANRVTQYEFVREFFTSNTISVFIDTAFVFVFLLVIYAIGGWLVIIPALAFVASVIVGLVTQRRIGKRVAASMNEASQRQSLLVEIDLDARDDQVAAGRGVSAAQMGRAFEECGQHVREDQAAFGDRRQHDAGHPADGHRRADRGRRLRLLRGPRLHRSDHRHRHAGQPRRWLRSARSP